jgi:hypothetical protein
MFVVAEALAWAERFQEAAAAEIVSPGSLSPSLQSASVPASRKTFAAPRLEYRGLSVSPSQPTR